MSASMQPPWGSVTDPHNAVIAIALPDNADPEFALDRLSSLRENKALPLGCVVFDYPLNTLVAAVQDKNDDPTALAGLFAHDRAVTVYPGAQFHEVCLHYGRRTRVTESTPCRQLCPDLPPTPETGDLRLRTCRCLQADAVELGSAQSVQALTDACA